MDYEGDDDEDNDLNDETTDAFNALVINIDPSTLPNEDN